MKFIVMCIKIFAVCFAIFLISNCAKSKEPDTPAPQPCNSPSGLASTLITASTAILNWTGNGAASYEVQYKSSSSNTWSNIATATTALSINLSGLISSTTYDWRVKANCASNFSSFSTAQFSTAFGGATEMGLADQYPGDVNIQNDPSVLYVEKFDDGLTAIFNRYDDKLNTTGMSVETDVPAGSINANAIKMTSTTGGVQGGGHLYKKFTPGFDSVVYVRYYVKYPSTSKDYFHHESIWFGGYNPATTWPNPQAGTCGLGSSRLSIAYEPVWQNTNPPGMDTYIYWGDMKQDAGGNCWGNVMVTEGATGYGNPAAPGKYPQVAFDQWICVEVMLRLNNPVTEYNGELAVWVNGVKVGHWGPGFPNGHWDKDKWYNNPADPAFQGFRWRTDPNLNINWLWLEYYHENPAAPSSYMKLSNIVMATKYIGPIKQ